MPASRNAVDRATSSRRLRSRASTKPRIAVTAQYTVANAAAPDGQVCCHQLRFGHVVDEIEAVTMMYSYLVTSDPENRPPTHRASSHPHTLCLRGRRT